MGWRISSTYGRLPEDMCSGWTTSMSEDLTLFKALQWDVYWQNSDDVIIYHLNKYNNVTSSVNEC